MAGPLDVEPLDIARLRCAPFRRSLGAGAAGTAGAYDAFLCVEVPLPWSRDISADEPFRTLFGGVAASFPMPSGRRVRPQAMVPAPGAEGWTRVLFHERTAPGGGPYVRREWWVDAGDAPELCSLLVAEADLSPFDDRRVEVPDHVVDLLVCTHGKRDTCCGSSGVLLHDQLQHVIDPQDPTVRVWRVSHTGGHRFAPTALTFPDGYAWAFLDAGLAAGLTKREIEPSELVSRCRGAASLGSPAAQAADAAVLAEVGWAWASARRDVVVTAFDRATLATGLRVAGELSDGRREVFDVDVEVERHVPQITCGSIDEPEYAVEPVWAVTGLTRI